MAIAIADLKMPLPRIVLWLALALALAAPQPAACAEALLHGHGLLWKIEGGGVAPSYLFGTIHLRDTRVTTLPGPVADAIAATRSLSIEVLLNAAAKVRTMGRMMITEGPKLDEIVGAALFDRVVDAAAPYGLNRNVVRHMKPWAMWLLLGLPPEEMKGGSAMPLDQALQAEAMRRGKPVYGLETIDEQLDSVAGFTEHEHIALLASAVDDRPGVEAMIEDMTRLYLARDIASIYDLMTTQSWDIERAVIDSVMERLIDFRNLRMTERMIARLDEGAAFVAVGAMHLPGERGMLHLLEQRGYTVSRVY
jgi:uncharacterized protein YbaP (TraB family)